MSGANEWIISLSGLLAVVLEYFPGLATRFEALTTWQKRAVVVGLLFVLAVVGHLAQCEQGFAACGFNVQQVWAMLQTMLVGGAVNQATFMLTKRS